MALAALLTACGKPAPAPEPVRAVKLVTIDAQARQGQVEYAGEVRARVESRLGFRVGGKITRRAVELGQRVQAGQLLAQLDAQDLRLADAAARAQVSSATTQRDLAAADLKRFQSLRDQGFISAAELERRAANLRAAQATLDQASAQQRAQGNQASYAQLLADAPGVVTAIEAEAGQVVAAGTPVVRVAQDGPRDVVFAVPEDRVAAVRVGQPMAARAWGSDAQWQGTVREVAASADPVTRTFAVKLALAGEAPPLGATVTVIADGAAAAPLLRLPTSALRQDAAGTAVWVYEPASGSVRAQPVQVAGMDGNDAVIAAGLAPGMQVVAAGVHMLQAGQQVKVWQPKGGASPASQAQEATENVASPPVAGPPSAPASR